MEGVSGYCASFGTKKLMAVIENAEGVSKCAKDTIIRLFKNKGLFRAERVESIVVCLYMGKVLKLFGNDEEFLKIAEEIKNQEKFLVGE